MKTNRSTSVPALRKRHANKPPKSSTWVNDRHSRLNPTRVRGILYPESLDEICDHVRMSKRLGIPIAICGGRHSMGAQCFAENARLVDTAKLNRVLRFDPEKGIVEIEAGINWPDLVSGLEELQGSNPRWSIAQKQTGVDELSLGGALAANIHGRGLTKAPIIEDVESFVLVTTDGDAIRCSREKNSELFRLAIGGYGLFGIIYSVELRLAERRRLRRVVRMAESTDLPPRFEERIENGFLFGDFQFAIDDQSKDFMRRGIFPCYEPVPGDTEMPSAVTKLAKEDWYQLLKMAHTDKTTGFERYAAHYARTDGQVYWSDTQQFTTYVDNYHERLDREMQSPCRGSEMISELYVPRSKLVTFLELARRDLRRRNASVIYGTVRLIQRDTESFLAWAREPWACIVMNLCVEHTRSGLKQAEGTFRKLIDRAIELGGSYYLTYHRWARRDQVLTCYPQFPEFLRLKREFDPESRFQSTWYRHHLDLLKNA